MTGAVGIDCPTATRCLVSGANGFGVLTNVGGAWLGDFQQFWSPTGSPDGEVSCGLPTTCHAIARGFVYTGGTGYYAVPAMIPVTPEGVAGPVQLLTDRQGSSNGISCVFGRNCTVVGLLHSAGANLARRVQRDADAAEDLAGRHRLPRRQLRRRRDVWDGRLRARGRRLRLARSRSRLTLAARGVAGSMPAHGERRFA
jgi:hypothetical protein